ncbi:MAG: NIL domain-containing protein [Chloroflexi bacterium]|nr:NIL domain-containing protein [Chloroflexota bacterium]MCH8869642.1 NIL domain-containing protein [Chloroflexota bacterium]MCH9038984.1 NIL domain-containing protein [Chloroflexota bacterium]MCI0771152.1 NIL domain-containing protein [Chloroflexota bacterium]MCI0790548.1 NIL domain-containing protein [Chloroflexota bacterium]
MAKRRIKLTFPQDLVKEPLIYLLGKNFEIVTNIRRADVRENMGWVVLELEGQDQEMERGLQWITESGVRVDPVSGDVVEG